MIVLAQVLLSTLFLLEALFEGGSPRLCQEGETVVHFKIISVPLKQKHTAKYKIYFFLILWRAGLEGISVRLFNADFPSLSRAD